MVRMTATEAARSFSDVLNRVAAGEEIEVVRNGAPVAVIRAPKPRFLSRDRFHELIGDGGTLDGAFAHDVREIRRGYSPPEDPWASSSTPTN
jgi:antitoxin (DNA-binding transcriptional repressor) of toxin-antitoxin stability system